MRAVNTLVIALASALPDGIPDEIVYIPEGENLIYPSSHPKGITVKLNADDGERIAAQFNSQLDQLAKGNIKPRLDFKHEADGPTSGYPTGFRYEAGRGLMCSVDWSGAGRSAIEGRDFAYFSPRFDLGKDHVPAGIPERGPLGALVNEPAFRNIERIAASDADIHINPNQSDTMMTLVTCGILSAAEATQPDAETLAKSRFDAMKDGGDNSQKKIEELEKKLADLQAQLEASEVEAAKSRKETAASEVATHVKRGAIAAMDDTLQASFREGIEAEMKSGGNTFRTILASLPALHADLGTPLVLGGEKAVEAAEAPKLTGSALLEAAFASDFA